jgi:hypothetical protein
VRETQDAESRIIVCLKLGRIIMYRRRAEPEALPCFEVPRHEGGRVMGTENQGRGEGPTLVQCENLA